MNAERFYTDGPTFSDFEEVTEDHLYRPIPRDWTIFITDVVNSTDSIRKGKYRDVNLIGASAVAVARNVLDSLEFPFAFGGDGATMLIPPEHEDELRSRLCGLQKLATNQFQLDLRAGAVPANVLDDRPEALEVARYEVAPGVSVAIFRGGGTAVAEQLIKQEPEKYGVSVKNPPDIELDGLSCRWKPIPSNRDHILSLLVRARTDPERSTYRTILDKLNRLYDGNLHRGNPVNTSGLSYRSAASCYQDEKRYSERGWSASYVSRLVEIALAVLLFRWNLPFYPLDANAYRNSLPTHSDYRKFDDMLRLTLDCTSEQIDDIVDFLDDLKEDGKVFYGHHTSSQALMTCFVEHLNDGGHIHFIDGGDGGYAMAAVQLKRQIQQSGAEEGEIDLSGDPSSPPAI